MQIEIFTIADAATDSGGKINVLGSFDTIFSPELPVIYPFFSLALKIRAYKGEPEVHKIEIQFNDPKQKPFIQPFRTDVVFKFVPESNSAIANVMLNLQGIKFTDYGNYSIELQCDAKINMTIPVLVRKQS